MYKNINFLNRKRKEENDPYKCPFCGDISTDIYDTAFGEDELFVCIYYYCENCGSKWIDNFTFDSMEIIYDSKGGQNE